MNPERAYIEHTDWARAVLRDGTSHQQWFHDRALHHCTPIAATPDDSEDALFRQFTNGDGSAQTLWRLGPEVQANIIVSASLPADDAPELVPTDVYSTEPTEPEPGSVASHVVLIPHNIYEASTVHWLTSAPTYYVTADMVTVMEAAAAAFDDLDLMPRLPSETGFVVLSRPLAIPDYYGTQYVHAFAWTSWVNMTTSLGTMGKVGEIWSFSSRKAGHDEELVAHARESWASKTAWRNDPDLLPVYADRFLTGDRIGPIVDDICATESVMQVAREAQASFVVDRDADGNTIIPPPEQWSAHIASLSARIDQETARRHAEHGGPKMVGRMQPYLAAFILLLTQQITHESTQEPGTSAVRLARKVNASRPSTVTVVDVRRSARRAMSQHGDEGEVGEGHRKPLDHRHLVGSHWKWQPYGPQRSLRRRIFVAGYVRGPDDRPLRVSPRVTRLS